MYIRISNIQRMALNCNQIHVFQAPYEQCIPVSSCFVSIHLLFHYYYIVFLCCIFRWLQLSATNHGVIARRLPLEIRPVKQPAAPFTHMDQL